MHHVGVADGDIISATLV